MSDFEVFSNLVVRLGGVAPSSPAAQFECITANTQGYQGLSYVSLGKEGSFAAVSTKPTFVVPQIATPFVADSAKFALLTGSALYHSGTLSQYGEGPMHVCPEGYIELSRTDATAYKIAENDLVTVTSASGSLQLKARITTRMSVGVVFAPYHFSDASINSVWSGAAVTSVSLRK
jgi:predicted molibdopterin-dependent oxidoreductase YjgC